MEKIKFKNGEVRVITDIDEIVKATLNSLYCRDLHATSKKNIESYLRKNKPIKCVLLYGNKKDYSIIYQYHNKNNEKVYDVYNGRESSSVIFDIHRELFLEYYNTVNDDDRVNNILKRINAGDEFFYKENYCLKYEKAKVTDIKVWLNYERLVVKIKTTKKVIPSSLYLLDIYKDGRIKDSSGIYYPYSFKQQIENKLMENKKKRLKSLERSINKLKNEIENGIIW